MDKNLYEFDDKPFEFMTDEEYRAHYKKVTGKEYTEPTKEERENARKEYGKYM